MRPFPRTARRRLAAVIAAGTLAIGALVVPLANAESGHLKERRQHAHQQVRHAEHDLDESSARLRHAQAAVERAVRALEAARGRYQAASARLSAAQLRDREMQQRLHEAEQRLDTAQAKLAEGEAALDDQREQLTTTVTDIYEQGDPHLLAFSNLLQSRSTTDLTRQEALNDTIVGREARAYDDLHAAEVLLQVRENDVQAARDDVEVQREAAAKHLVMMRQLHREARAAKHEVRAKVKSRRDARAVAARARQHDLRALKAAKARENRIKQRILAAARRARRAHRGYRGPTNGLFIRPVNGVVTSPFGYRMHPIYHYWGLHDGTDFGVSCGQALRAVAGGTVVARYWSDVYGNRLYLNLGQVNGKYLTAVYNHASGYRVGVGAHVSQGEVLGYVGSTGWSTGCHLHFTMLVNGHAVNPMGYLP